MKKDGKWGLKSVTSAKKIKYLLKKILEDYNNPNILEGILYCGTQNQVKWIKNKLIEKGIIEKDVVIKQIDPPALFLEK